MFTVVYQDLNIDETTYLVIKKILKPGSIRICIGSVKINVNLIPFIRENVSVGKLWIKHNA